jgi:soluble lytic murein transglycosylase
VRAWHGAVSLRDLMTDGELDPADVLRVAQYELLLGRAGDALSILSDYPLPDSLFSGAPLRVFASALYEKGEYEAAGGLFVRAAGYAPGSGRGVLHARAGEAFERAGRPDAAASQYRVAAAVAAAELPAIAGWLAIREARVTHDTARAFALLSQAPAAGRLLASEARGVLHLAYGDTATAIHAMDSAGQSLEAARLAMGINDGDLARRLAYKAVGADDRTAAMAAADFVIRRFPPATVDEYVAVARQLSRFGRQSQAVPLLEKAIAAGDSSVTTLLLLGEAMEGSRRRVAALGVYEKAAGGEGTLAQTAEFRRARALLRLRRRTAAVQALTAFAQRHPEHASAPLALYLAADVRDDAGRVSEAARLFRMVEDTWPLHRYASRARFRRASRALRRGDTEAAMELYRREAELGGREAAPARFQMARILGKRGDSTAAHREWEALAREDSLGYYGTIAREAGGLPLPNFGLPPDVPPAPEIAEALTILDLLDEAGFTREAQLHVEELAGPDGREAAELMDVAEGLIARGRTREAIRLGWRITADVTLNHPRVVRIIFPWPNRRLVEREAREFGLDPFLVVGLIRQESAFDPDATSRAGARGLMQLMPTTADELARRLGVDWSDDLLGVADANMHLGVAHLSALLRHYDGRVIPTLAAYNAGGTPVARWLRFPEANDPFLFVERIPYVETRGYVRTVLRNRAIYEALYGGAVMP